MSRAIFIYISRNKNEHADHKYCDLNHSDIIHTSMNDYHPLSHGQYPFRKKAQEHGKYLLYP